MQVRKSKVLFDPASILTLCMRAAKALARLRICAGSSEPSLLASSAGVISNKSRVLVLLLNLHCVASRDGSKETMRMRVLV